MTEGFIGSEAVPLAAIRELCNSLQTIHDAAGPADRETLGRVMDILNFQHGMICGLESRLAGDMATVPEQALTGVVLQHVGDEPAAYAAGMSLARDVRLICFFHAIERAQS